MKYSLEPVLHVVHLSTGYRVDVERWLREVLEDEDQVKLFQTVLNTFE